MWKDVALLAVGGALGSVSRYGVSSLATRLGGTDFPYGTLAVNVLGSAVIGLLMHLVLTQPGFPREVRLAVVVGFLGAFTTFSTFSYETTRALEAGQLGLAGVNIATNVLLCVGATVAGLAVGRALW